MPTNTASELKKIATALRQTGEKKAYLIDSLVRSATSPSGFLWPVFIGGGLGALVAGEGSRPEGALAGILGGAIGKSLLGSAGKSIATRMANLTPEQLKALEHASKREAFVRAHPEIAKMLDRQAVMVGEAGRVAGASGGGYLLGAKADHDRRRGITETEPVMYDLGGKYTGFLPEEMNDPDIFGL